MSHLARSTPDFVIIGAPKCGTSSLFDWLAQHPGTCPSTRKETYFLVDPGTHMHDARNHVSNGIEGYARWFPAGDESALRFEATPAYLYSKTALQVIADLPGAPRVVIVLREPASQIWSLYRYFRSNWSWIPQDMSFKTFVTAVEKRAHGFNGNDLAANALHNAEYITHLDRWRQTLGEERMTVRLFEDLRDDPRAFVEDLGAEFGLDAEPFARMSLPSSNQTYAVRSKPLQSLNERIRGRIPQGRTYRGLRHIYRKLNTTRPASPDAAERDVMLGLRARYAHHNTALADAYGLNLQKWTPERIDG